MKFFQYGHKAINLEGICFLEVGHYQSYYVSIYYSFNNRTDSVHLGSFKKQEEAEQLLSKIVAVLNGTVNEEKNSTENSKTP